MQPTLLGPDAGQFLSFFVLQREVEMAIMGRPKKKKRSKGDALTHTSVRISDRIKQALLAEAERNRRSMCAEINVRLEASFKQLEAAQ